MTKLLICGTIILVIGSGGFLFANNKGVSKVAKSLTAFSYNYLKAPFFIGRDTMPTGVYKRTEGEKERLRNFLKDLNIGRHCSEETRKKISESNKGKIRSEETRKKISESSKGRIPWMKGKHHSEETKRKLSKAKKGKRGTPHTEATKEKMSEAKKGKPNGREGTHLSAETKLKISKANKGKHFLSKKDRVKMGKARIGANSPRWKGGITPIYQKHRAKTSWKETVKKVYKRDNYRCQLCGKGGGMLNAHHIIPWRVEHNDKMSNLITLCIPCHSKVEAKWQKYAPIFLERIGTHKKSIEEPMF